MSEKGNNSDKRRKRRRMIFMVAALLVAAIIVMQFLLLQRLESLVEQLGMLKGEMEHMDQTVSEALEEQESQPLAVELPQFTGEYRLEGKKLKIDGTVQGSMRLREGEKGQPVAVFLGTERNGEVVDYIRTSPEETEDGWSYSFDYKETISCAAGDRITVNIRVSGSRGYEYNLPALRLSVGENGSLTEEELLMDTEAELLVGTEEEEKLQESAEEEESLRENIEAEEEPDGETQ